MTESKPGSATRHRILVVDDSPETAQLIREWFAHEPYEIIAVGDGQAGLEAAAAQDPDVIVLDLLMPVLDGIETARQLRGNPSTAALPIVVLTAQRDSKAKLNAFRAGADSFLTKPIVLEELEAVLRTMLRRRKYLRGLEQRVDGLEASKVELEQRLAVDEKTGLYNFREFQRRLIEEFERALRYETPLSLIFFDIDHFKQVNDTVGHPAGDRVLGDFATLVTGGARSNDIAARYGGEEFAMVLPHTDGEMAVRVAERICSAVRDFVFLEDEAPRRITVSAGVATFPSSTVIGTVDDLIQAADQALYAAKDSGRDRVIRNGAA